MKKRDNMHRVVKIDYSVLKEFLDYFNYYDGVFDWNDFEEEPSLIPFNERLRKKAQNIIENS